MDWKTALRAWMPPGLWIVLILVASGDAGSSLLSRRLLYWALGLLHISVSQGAFQILHWLLRKSAHVFIYGMLSWLVLRAARTGTPTLKGRLPAALLAIALCASTAVADEWHQAFVVARTSSRWDVMLDVAAATLVQLVLWVASRSRTRPLTGAS